MKANGFTLVELLVALLIFGMLSAAGVALLSFSVRSQESSRAGLEELTALRRAGSLLSSDLSQAATRLHRSESGAARPAFFGSTDGFGMVRRGWENPDGAARSSLQRVEYRLHGQRLERHAFPMVDGAPSATAITLMDGIVHAQLRYRAGNGEWRDRWDPTSPGELPTALELVLEKDRRGSIRQLFLVGTGF